jgi:hypothetical protein
MEPASDPFLARIHLYADLKERLLICEECGYALASDRSQVTSHLRDKHHIDQRDRRGLTKHLNTRYPLGFRNPAEVPLRANGSDIHPRLAVHEGFACCGYRTVGASRRYWIVKDGSMIRPVAGRGVSEHI